MTALFADMKKPDEVIIDASEALISASVQAFAHCPSTNKYVSECWLAALENRPPPPCFIRIDRSHFVRSINGNKLWRKLDDRVGPLIRGLIGYLIQCDSIDIVKITLEKVFTVIRNPYNTIDVDDARFFLTNLIKTHSVFDECTVSEDRNDYPHDQITPQNGDDKMTVQSGKDTYRDTIGYTWLKGISDTATVDVHSSSTHNIFFSQKLHDFLLELFVRLPMWSNVMCAVCGSTNYNPSSSAIESEFENIKRLLGIKTKSVDVFIDLHLKHLSGKIKLELGDQKNIALQEIAIDNPRKEIHKSQSSILNAGSKNPKRSSSMSRVHKTPLHEDITSNILHRSRSENDIFSSSDSEISIDNRKREIPQENWKNKNRSSPTLRRAKCSILNPHDVDYKYNSVPMLKNSYKAPRKIRKKIVDVTHTCAFDSALSIYIAAFLDNEKLHSIIDSSDETLNKFSFFIKRILQKRQPNKEHYNDKTDILFQLYSRFYKKQVIESDNTISMDCQTTFGPLLKKLLQDIDGGVLLSASDTKTCTACRIATTDEWPLMRLQLVHTKINLKRLSSYIIPHDRVWTCRKCNENMQATMTYGDIIAFDVEPLTSNLISTTQINNIQQTLHINEDIYKLFGVVEYKQSIRHFIAHVKRKNDIWETYDDLKSEMVRSRKCATNPMVVFAVFYMKS